MTRLNSQSLPSAVLTSIEHIGPTSTHPERKPCLEPVLTRCFWLPRVGPRQLNILIPGQIQVYPFWIRQRIWARKFFAKIDGYKSLGSPRRGIHGIKEARILFGNSRVWMEWVWSNSKPTLLSFGWMELIKRYCVIFAARGCADGILGIRIRAIWNVSLWFPEERLSVYAHEDLTETLWSGRDNSKWKEASAQLKCELSAGSWCVCSALLNGLDRRIVVRRKNVGIYGVATDSYMFHATRQLHTMRVLASQRQDAEDTLMEQVNHLKGVVLSLQHPDMLRLALKDLTLPEGRVHMSIPKASCWVHWAVRSMI